MKNNTSIHTLEECSSIKFFNNLPLFFCQGKGREIYRKKQVFQDFQKKYPELTSFLSVAISERTDETQDKINSTLDEVFRIIKTKIEEENITKEAGIQLELVQAAQKKYHNLASHRFEPFYPNLHKTYIKILGMGYSK